MNQRNSDNAQSFIPSELPLDTALNPEMTLLINHTTSDYRDIVLADESQDEKK